MTNAAAMSCPVCHVPLMMSERQGVEIDYCPQCRGVWLDRGELDKIIKRGVRETQPAPAQQTGYSQSPRDAGYGHGQPHGYRKRKKSFLEELFD